MRGGHEPARHLLPATYRPRWNGLSPLGKQWVAEMNRLGIVIDASHSSDPTFDQFLALSKYPILLSHSSLRSVHDHPRNLDEGRLKALAAKSGSMCISTVYMSEMNLSLARASLFGKYEHSRARAFPSLGDAGAYNAARGGQRPWKAREGWDRLRTAASSDPWRETKCSIRACES